MPRRRLSEQQRRRIEAIRARRQQQRETRTECLLAAATRPEAPIAGLVAARHGANLAIEREDGGILHCVSRRHIGEPVCGDQVICERTGAGTGVITELKPRASLLSRADGAGREKPLVANLTRLIIVVAPEPPPAGDLIDHYLVAAERGAVPALLLCNKADLMGEPNQHPVMMALGVYQAIGYPIMQLSTRQPESLTALRALLGDGISLLVGQSGVGKSSITQALLPDREVQIGQLSRATGLGCHTTSAARCYRLPEGGHLIDSPGVRSFRLPALTRSELETAFREFRPHLGRCRFANCRHDAEPECAIQAALAAGHITPARWQAFQRLADAHQREST